DVTIERDAKGKIAAARSKDGKELKYAVERMSKSKGNGVDPDEMIDIYGADAARLFVLFAAPVENELVWHEAGIEGAVRFLQRVWRFIAKWQAVLSANGSTSEPAPDDVPDSAARKLRRKTHETIKKIDDNLNSLQFNTPVAALMELSNAIYDLKTEPETASATEIEAVREAVNALVLMLAPFAPHIAEELFSNIVGNDDGILANGGRFPAYLEELAKSDEIEIAVQVNGKLRSRIFVVAGADEEMLRAVALTDEKVREYIDGKEIVKVVVVPGRLVSVVVRG
ncbi:MAG TPA: class I tRNA ligase family protein, partial [Pyrinomonadaceae bacterium]|nr:class I tRNA ligase family protein [Pyrinomonadaceae bacterium]